MCGAQDQVEPAGADKFVQSKFADPAERQVDQEPVGAGAMSVCAIRILVHFVRIGLADMHQDTAQFGPIGERDRIRFPLTRRNFRRLMGKLFEFLPASSRSVRPSASSALDAFSPSHARASPLTVPVKATRAAAIAIGLGQDRVRQSAGASGIGLGEDLQRFAQCRPVLSTQRVESLQPAPDGAAASLSLPEFRASGVRVFSTMTPRSVVTIGCPALVVPATIAVSVGGEDEGVGDGMERVGAARRRTLRRQRHDTQLDSVSRLENRQLLNGGRSRSRSRGPRREADGTAGLGLPGPAALVQERLRELEQVVPERLVAP